MRITLTLIALAVLVTMIKENNRGRAQRSPSRSTLTRTLPMSNLSTAVAAKPRKMIPKGKTTYVAIPKDYEADIVSRLNYGAYYTHVASTSIVNAIWHHRFMINLPNEAWAQVKDESELIAFTGCMGTEASKIGCLKFIDHYEMMAKI